MADLLYSTLPNSLKFSHFSFLAVPLNFSPHPNSSIIRFVPLRRRFLHSSILAKLSSDSSQFDIISRTEHSDGSVIFKFGDASEISHSVENLEGGNEVELEKEGNSSLIHQANSVANDESDVVSITAESIIVDSVEVKKIGNELLEFSLIDSQSDAQSIEDSVEYEHNIDSFSIANGPAPADSQIDSQSDAQFYEDSVEDEQNLDSTSTTEMENSSGFDTAKHEIKVVNNIVTTNDSNVDVMIEKTEELIEASEEMINDDDKLEYGGDESLSIALEETSDGGKVGYGDDNSSSATASAEMNDGGKLTYGDDELSAIDSEKMSDNGKLEYGGDEEMSDVGKVEYVGDNSSSAIASEEMNDGGKLTYGDDESSSIDSEKMSDNGQLEYGGDEEMSDFDKLEYVGDNSSSAIASEENNDDGKLTYGGGESSSIDSEKMIDGGKLEYGGDEEMSDVIKLEHVGDESSNISAASLNIEASDMKESLEDEIMEPKADDDDDDDDAAKLASPQLEAEPILDEETSVDSLADVVAISLGSDKVMEAGHSSIARLDDDQHTRDISDAATPGNEASEIASTETNFDSLILNLEDLSSGAASSSNILEVNDASPPTISQSDDDQHCSDISQASGPGSELSEVASAKVSLDSMEITTVTNPMMPAASSSPDSTEVHDTTPHTISQSDGLSDISVAAGRVSSGNSAETIDSPNEVETSAPALFPSSAVASLSHSLEALTGGKDAYFVSEDWFGVADGVGQWSLEGVDVGLYAHELMQNCEKLLKSASAGITNVKDLLRQSDAMTHSTGSARVVIAHVANQVLHVANIGDSGFVIIRNGTIFKKSSPMVHEFGFPYAIGLGDDSVEDVEEYHIEIEDGDVIVTATDGLFDNLYEQEIASTVSKAMEAGMYVQDVAELLATKAQEVGKSEYARSPFADAAQAAGHPGYSGGKFDHVTVIVSLVQTR